MHALHAQPYVINLDLRSLLVYDSMQLSVLCTRHESVRARVARNRKRPGGSGGRSTPFTAAAADDGVLSRTLDKNDEDSFVPRFKR